MEFKVEESAFWVLLNLHVRGTTINIQSNLSIGVSSWVLIKLIIAHDIIYKLSLVLFGDEKSLVLLTANVEEQFTLC